MIKKTLTLALHTFSENIKQRNFLILAVYILFVLGSGVLFSMLAPAEEIRVILDLGLSAIEAFAFLSSAFISVKLVLQEIENKTLYLILSRPVSRTSYLAGRYAGILLLSAVQVSLMTAALGGLLIFKGWSPDMLICAIALSVIMKVAIISAAGILISLISTSQASSLIIISFLWALGHFSSELRHLAARLAETGSAAAILVSGVSYIIPDFNALNYKDIVSTAGTLPQAGLYTAEYSLALLFFAAVIFEKKEL